MVKKTLSLDAQQVNLCRICARKRKNRMAICGRVQLDSVSQDKKLPKRFLRCVGRAPLIIITGSCNKVRMSVSGGSRILAFLALLFGIATVSGERLNLISSVRGVWRCSLCQKHRQDFHDSTLRKHSIRSVNAVDHP